ncbi:MAG: sulfite exporter TauE/SafE family protein [Clostridia bacterium]|nr:sulfite exporter TauE/SafE family protein [Clostridia bacterium]
MIDFIAGTIVAALSGMGVGGGGLLVIYLVFVKNMGQIESQGINLLFFIISASSAFLYNLRKRKINFRLCILLCICGIFGAVVGALCANIIAPVTVRKIFGWLLVASGVWSVISDKKKNKKISKKG